MHINLRLPKTAIPNFSLAPVVARERKALEQMPAAPGALPLDLIALKPFKLVGHQPAQSL